MKKIYILLITATYLLGFSKTTLLLGQCNAPVVNSFSPNTGFIGSTVTINGAFFDPIPANNQVFFGATKATVLTASFGTLTVVVPTGSTTAPIAVKNNCNLIGYSPLSFNGIFCPTPISTSSYNSFAQELSGVNGAYNMLSQDLDNDGKPEIVSAYNGLTVAHNNSTPGNISFSAVNFGNGGNYNSFISTADFDGDGKRDLFGTNNFYRNTSSGPGNINFAVTSSGFSGYQNGVGDFNNDGKIDLVYGSGGDLVFMRNTSTGPGNISFTSAGTVAVTFNSTGIQVVDVDGDGKVDVLATQGDGNRMIALRNTTASGNTSFSFGSVQSFSTGGAYPYRCAIADFDKDGKTDLATVNFNQPTNDANTAILRNISTVGSIDFANAVTFPGPVNNYRIAVGDFNGDGFPDIVTKSLAVVAFAGYINTSSGAGNINFASRIDYSSAATAEVSGIAIGDLDGDYVPDIVTSGISSNTIRFHRNTSSANDVTPPTAICKNIIVGLSPTGNVSVTPTMINNGSSDACGIDSLKINGQQSINFTCANIGANTVTLTVIDKSGNSSTCTATVTVAAAAIIAAGQTTVCQGQSVLLTANAGDTYQWQMNGSNISGATSQNYTATTSGNYSVIVTNSGGCSGTSSATVVTVTTVSQATATLSGPPNICQGNFATITASSGSAFNWSNGANSQSISVGTAGAYTVTVFDANGCTSVSNAVSLNVNPLPTLNIASSSNAVCSGNSIALNPGTFASYVWSTSATTQTINVSTTGTYSVTVTDTNGCSNSSSKRITVYNPTVSLQVNPPCNGSTNGSINAIASGGALKSFFASGGNNNGGNLHRINPTNGSVTLIGNMGIGPVPAIAINSQGDLYASNANSLFKIDPTTAVSTAIGSFTGRCSQIAAMSFDNADVLYAMDFCGLLYTVDINSGNLTQIGNSGINVSGIQFDPTDGSLWATDRSSIFKINKNTGASTNIGSTGFSQLSDLLFRSNGDLYASRGGGGNTQYLSINKSNGSASVIATTTNNLSGLAGIPSTENYGSLYTYLWSNNATTNSLNGLGAGTYSVTITDGAGCTAVNSSNLQGPTVTVGNDTTICNGSAKLRAVGNPNGANTNPQITSFCMFDYQGGNGGCNFSTNLCSDGYDYFSSTKSYSTTISSSIVSGLNFKLFYTCGAVTFTFKINGNVLGTYSDNGVACTCEPQASGTYPKTISFTQAQVEALWTGGVDTVSIDVTAGGGSWNAIALAGLVAELLTPGESYTWSPATSLNDSSVANPIATPTVSTNYTVTYTASNGCTATDQVNVTVQCNVPPVAVCKSVSVAANGNCQGMASAADFDGGSTDQNGDPLSFSVSPTGPYGIGTTNVVLTVSDTAGTSDTCWTTITVIDSASPILSNAGNQSLNTIAGTCAADYTIADPISDNCSGSTWSYSLSGATTGSGSSIADGTGSGTISFNKGVTTVTIDGVDAAGNNATQTSFTVTVSDNENPTLSNAGNQSLNTIAGTCVADYTIADPISDNCSGATWSYSLSGATTGSGSSIADGTGSGTISFNKGVTTVTINGVDASGNNATQASFTVTVSDNENPVARAKNIGVTLVNGSASITASSVDDGSSDNCGIQSMSVSPNSFTCANIGDNTVTLTVTDAAGNSHSQTATVNVSGSIPTVNVTASNLPKFCQGSVRTLTANTTTNIVSYAWSNGANTISTNVGTTGTYVVTVTNNFGCTASGSLALTITPSDLLSSYTILGLEKVHIYDKSYVQSGGVGANATIHKKKVKGEIKVEDSSTITGSSTFARSLEIEVKKQSVVTNQIVDSLNIAIPAFLYNTLSKNMGINVNTANGSTVTLNDTVYKDVKVGKNATVIFTAPVVYLKKLHGEDGATIKFSNCTEVRIDDHFHLHKDNNFNPDGNSVVVYVEKHAHIHEGSTVKGVIYALDKLETKGKKNDRVSMTGLFISEHVHGTYTTWNWGTSCTTNCNFKATQMTTANKDSDLLQAGEVRLNVYPNPSMGRFTIDINSPQKGTMHVTIYNPLGQIVKSIQDTEFDGVNSIEVDLTKYASTYYLVKVDLPGGSTTRKVVMLK